MTHIVTPDLIRGLKNNQARQNGLPPWSASLDRRDDPTWWRPSLYDVLQDGFYRHFDGRRVKLRAPQRSAFSKASDSYWV